MNDTNNKIQDKKILEAVVFVMCVGVIGLIFKPYMGLLVELWIEGKEATYSHGPLIPFIIVYLIWDKRSKLQSLKAHPSWKGGGTTFLLSSLIWLVAVGGRSRFVVEVSIIFLIISFVWLNFGTTITKQLSFPLSLVFLMAPLPSIFYVDISNALQLASSKMSVVFLHLFNVPVYREGNIINLPNAQLEVANACSGINSLVSLFTLALIFGYITQNSLFRRVVITFSSLFIALIMNWFRIFVTSLLTYYWTEKIAQGFYHTFSGWLVFVVAFLFLLLIDKLLNLSSWTKKRVALQV